MPTKKRIQYRYTPTGQRSALIDPDGGRFTYSYDSVKRLTQVINPQGERTSYSYDADGRRTLKKLANGSRTSFSYDAASRITSVAHLKSDASVQAKYDYKYDKAGNRTAMSETGASTAGTTWSYDAAYQLTGEHRTGANAFRNTYVYDNRGNRTLKNLDGARTTSSYDDANQLKWSEAAGGRTTYVFDADGNQQVVLSPSGDRVTNLWDYENRLIGVLHPDGSRETMAYDPDGKRAKLQAASSTTKYVWDDQNYLAETDASDVTQVVYTNEPRTYGNLISQRKAGASHYYLFDALGSTRLVTDASQNVAESLLYDAWGNLVGSAPTLAVPFRWVGELGYLFVPVTGDYYVRARVYRPTIGRWISQDPLEFVDGEDRYRYINGRVTFAADPSGTQGPFLDPRVLPRPRPRPRGAIGGIIGSLIHDYQEEQWHREHPNYWLGFAEAVGFPPALCGSVRLHPREITVFGPVETDSVFQILIRPEANIDDAILFFVQDIVEPQFESLASQALWECPQDKKCCILARIAVDVDLTVRVHAVYPVWGGDLNSVVSVRAKISQVSRFGVCVDKECPCPDLLYDRTIEIDADLSTWPPIPLEGLMSD